MYLLASAPVNPMVVETLQVPTFLLAKIPVVSFWRATLSPDWMPDKSAFWIMAETNPS